MASRSGGEERRVAGIVGNLDPLDEGSQHLTRFAKQPKFRACASAMTACAGPGSKDYRGICNCWWTVTWSWM